MLTLTLLRHAKSSWDNLLLPDYERPLAKRGQKAAPQMGAALAAMGLRPDLVICSGAARARETLALLLDGLGAPAPPVVFDDAVYMAPPEALLARLRRVGRDGPAPRHVMLIGHNPGLEELAALLVGSGDRQARARMAEKFPTAAVAVIDFRADAWSAIAPDAGALRHFLTPKRLT